MNRKTTFIVKLRYAVYAYTNAYSNGITSMPLYVYESKYANICHFSQSFFWRCYFCQATPVNYAVEWDEEIRDHQDFGLRLSTQI